MKVVHPSKFFDEVGCRICIDVFEQYDPYVKEQLKSVHPLNFLKTRITLPVFKITISYRTIRGNLRNAEKYIVLDNSLLESSDSFNYYVESNVRMECDSYNLAHKKNPMLDYMIEKIEFICDAVLPIG